jgi:hypothetical protein
MNNESGPDNDPLIAAGRRAFRDLADAPEAAIRRAEAVWPRAPGLLARVQALLTIDSWTTPLPALRSSRRASRQLLFTAGERDIEVRIIAAPQGWTLEGQVLGPADGAVLRLSLSGEPAGVVELDELGAFCIEGLSEGQYTIVLYCGTERVELPAIDIAGDGPA